MTNERWEIREPLLLAIEPPGTRRYVMVEIGLNVPLFLAEVVVSADPDEGSLWQTFLLADFNNVISLLSANPLKDYAVSLFLPRYESDDYEHSISTIIEAYQGKDVSGASVFLYVCANGRRFLDSSHRQNDTDLTGKVLVYSQKKPTAPGPCGEPDDG